MDTTMAWLTNETKARTEILRHDRRRCDGILAQVWKKVWDLHHEIGSDALPWRRSLLKNLTCAKTACHLRQNNLPPAPNSLPPAPKQPATCAKRNVSGEYARAWDMGETLFENPI